MRSKGSFKAQGDETIKEEANMGAKNKGKEKLKKKPKKDKKKVDKVNQPIPKTGS